jgi:DNA-binding MurR/RpiR family transcriptional regulator
MSEEEEGKTAAEEQLELLARQKFQERLEQHDMATRAKMIQAMRENNADPAYIYAFEKTGLLVFQETMDALTPEQLEEWAEAYEEYSG